MAHASGDNKSGSQPSEEQVVLDEEIGHVRVVTLNSPHWQPVSAAGNTPVNRQFNHILFQVKKKFLTRYSQRHRNTKH